MEWFKPVYILYIAILLISLLLIWFFIVKKRISDNVSSVTTSYSSSTSTSAFNLKISNKSGASIFTEANSVMTKTSETIPFGTQVEYTSIVKASYCPTTSQVCPPPSDFYKIDVGFLDKKDITII